MIQMFTAQNNCKRKKNGDYRVDNEQLKNNQKPGDVL